MAGRRGARGFGHLRRLPSKRWQASYVGPDLRRHLAPSTFEAREDAEGWLAARRAEISGDDWQPPIRRRPVTVSEHAERWLANRTLRPRTHAHYRRLLDSKVLPVVGDVPLKAVTADVVDDWYYRMGDATPTLTAHAYGLLRSILGDAVQRRLIDHNPCHIRGAGNSRRVHTPRPATLGELEAIAAATPERYRLMVLFASWCAMRFGELTELRRRDIDVNNGVIHVRRAVVRVNGTTVVSTPKSDAGTRDVAIPPHLMPMVSEHLASHVGRGRDALLFPAADGESHLAPSTLYKGFYGAREAAGRPDLRFHDLRHTGAVLAASTGATLAELMGRLGHSTPGAAMRYQHAAKGRDAEIAAALSALHRQSRAVGERAGR
ncbi:MAG: site-specific integrase [Propionibacteriales bacterium]|nr:site-specific integrase [Propionibacteriales bacterium]